MSEKCIFKVKKFQLDTLSRFRMVEEKQEGGGHILPPPGKIGLKNYVNMVNNQPSLLRSPESIPAFRLNT